MPLSTRKVPLASAAAASADMVMASDAVGGASKVRLVSCVRTHAWDWASYSRDAATAPWPDDWAKDGVEELVVKHHRRVAHAYRGGDQLPARRHCVGQPHDGSAIAVSGPRPCLSSCSRQKERESYGHR